MSDRCLTVKDADGVRLLTLNRPEVRNALSIELREMLAEAVAGIDPENTGAVVITGAGPAFCSGMDVTQFGGDEAHKGKLVESSLACFEAVGKCPVPTLAAVNGPAVAGGFVLALACDLRIAEPSSSFGFPELPRGIPPSYAWARAALPAAVARRLCLTGEIVSGEDSLAQGIASEYVGDGESPGRAREIARQAAERPRSALLETKRRILLERREMFGFLFEDEERMFRRALLGEG